MTALSFSILAPDLTLPERRMLKVMMQKANFTTTGLDFATKLTACRTRHILSIGKAGLDAWHEFGLIGVGAHHGCVFRHWDGGKGEGRLGHRVIMVLHHPGTLMQMTLGGYEAKDQMAFDLVRWRGVVGGLVEARGLRQTMCGRCGCKRRDPVRREACHWVDELDGCGLCEDCYRGRSKIVRKPKGRKAKPSSAAAQLPGQTEAFPDGAHLMVTKS